MNFVFLYFSPQGAIQGPEEFVEGMALGLKALFGGAVGKEWLGSTLESNFDEIHICIKLFFIIFL